MLPDRAPNIVSFKKLHDGVKLPSKAHDTDSGFDVYAVEDFIIPCNSSVVVSTGLEVADISKHFWFRIEGKSGLATKHHIEPFNGIIDNGYRGEVKVLLNNFGDYEYHVKAGDKIVQFIMYVNHIFEMRETDTKTVTERNENGFGSTGK